MPTGSGGAGSRSIEQREGPHGGRSEGRARGQALRGPCRRGVRGRGRRGVHPYAGAHRVRAHRGWPGVRGQGVGSALARAALDEARAANLRVLATCPFFAGWIARHPDYQDLLYRSRSRVED
ncbi:GNAT family N-acetyltransferase [Nocardiopsis changdeensis]|uniref:GNAT family N-acetyltransferase n=1 Tax=Nocardiopsis changdeensis TaxID=2831969 RepID=UPI003B9D835B